MTSPSGLGIAGLQRQLRPNGRDGIGQAIVTIHMHLNATMNDALCATGDCVENKASHEQHD